MLRNRRREFWWKYAQRINLPLGSRNDYQMGGSARAHQPALHHAFQPKFVWISFASLASFAVKKFRTQPERQIINR